LVSKTAQNLWTSTCVTRGVTCGPCGVHLSLQKTASSFLNKCPNREPVNFEPAELGETTESLNQDSTRLRAWSRARQNSWLHCIDIRFWSLLDYASSSASSADEKIVCASETMSNLLSWSECRTVNFEVADSIPTKPQKTVTENSNLHVFELHRPSKKGTT